MSQYLDMFFEESREHLQAINDNLLALESNPENLDVIQDVFRSAHTLKGMSATMGFEKMAHLTHEMENGLDLMRSGKLPVTPFVMDLLFRCVDLLESILPMITEQGSDKGADIQRCVDDLKAITSGNPIPEISNVASSSPKTTKTETDLAVNEYENTILEQSSGLGFSAYQLEVILSEKCLLKAARAYMVVHALEEAGELLRTEPSVEDLEEENFDRSFKVLALSKLSQDELKKIVLSISEVTSCDIASIESKLIYSKPVELVNSKSSSAVEQNVSKETTQPSRSQESKPTANTDKKIQSASRSVRVDIERLDILMNLFSELVIDRTRLEQIAADIKHPDLAETVEHMSRISGDLQNIVMTIRMVPVDTVFNRFPRMVRDLAKDLGKKVEFVIRGAETELDRTVIDEIGDPLVHMLRNALDHALETPQERIAAGKDETGHLELLAYHSGNHVFIEVTDDGRGINRNNVLKKAIERKLIQAEDADMLSDEMVFDLLFRSGFSTAEKVSDLSGRGVGLDVVKNKIESLGGRVVIQSQPGKGTKFMIQLPLTLSIIQALLVTVSSETFAIPLSSIMETASLHKSEIKHVQKQEVLDFRGKIIPLVSLNKLFKIPEHQQVQSDECHVVIVRKGDRMTGLLVDTFIGQQEVVLKSLGKYLSTGIFAISGATILGDGQVALILDCNSLIR